MKRTRLVTIIADVKGNCESSNARHFAIEEIKIHRRENFNLGRTRIPEKAFLYKRQLKSKWLSYLFNVDPPFSAALFETLPKTRDATFVKERQEVAETCASFRSTNSNGRELCHSGRTDKRGMCQDARHAEKERKSPREREREGESTRRQ